MTERWQAATRRLRPWGGMPCRFSCSYTLDPQDPLFQDIGEAFVQVPFLNMQAIVANASFCGAGRCCKIAGNTCLKSADGTFSLFAPGAAG